MKEYLHIVTAVAVLAFVTYPTFADAPTGARRGPILTIWPSASIIFGGDMMFDRSIRATAEARGEDFIFSCIADVLRSVDLVVANLEGPITEYPSISKGSV